MPLPPEPESVFSPSFVPGSASLPGLDVPRLGPVFGSKYAVSTDHPAATLAALDVLRRGGNAVDAALAASAVNAVTKPQMTQLGGDAFALVWRKGPNTVDCINAGGRAPNRATLDLFPNGLPQVGPLSCTVPGLVDAWGELHLNYATMPLDTLLEPAIRLCEEGFPVSTRLHGAMLMLEDDLARETAPLRDVMLKHGRAYAPGETLRQPDLAATLRRIAENAREGYPAREGFYTGETGSLLAKGFADYGGIIAEGDFEEATALWHDPLQVAYRGYDVYEQALPSQGIILLESLNIAENFPLADWGLNNPDSLHVLIETTKLAFADSRQYSADPLVEDVPVERLLSKEYASDRAASIDLRRAREHAPALAGSHNTTEFVVGDGEMAVAFIQSVFSAWGSRFLIPGTGVLMNNRLRGFSTDPGAANSLKPGKRTVHTLNTFLALRDGRLAVGGGTPGMDFQVQNNLQSLVGAIDWGLDLHTAVNMPRWVWHNGFVAMESRFPGSVMDELASRGHDVRRVPAWDGTIARSQLIGELPDGGWAVASDLRGEGLAAAV